MGASTSPRFPALGACFPRGEVELVVNATGMVEVDADVDLDLNFTLDLSSLASPSLQIHDDSQITFHELTVKKVGATPIDAKAELVVAGQTILGFAVKDAAVDIDLAGTISLADGGEDHRHAISDLVDDQSLWDIDLVGNLDVDLPLFFPTASSPMGGTLSDLDGDGLADNVLHVSGQFRGAQDFDLEYAVPNLLDFGALFDQLRDPKALLTGLTGFFDGMRDVADRLGTVEIPLIGSANFDKLGDQIRSLEEAVMGKLQGGTFVTTSDKYDYTNSVRYETGGASLGVVLQAAIDAGVEDVFDTILELLRDALYDGLSTVQADDPDLFSFELPVLDGDGNVEFEDGRIKTVSPG